VTLAGYVVHVRTTRRFGQIVSIRCQKLILRCKE
jgi:hypothetical protein